MKKLLISFCLMSVISLTFAQSTTFGVRGGVNFANLLLHTSNSDNILLYNLPGSLTTFSVGAFVDFKFGNFSLQPSINYTVKGDNEKMALGGDSSFTKNWHLNYLEIPVDLAYHIKIAIGNIYIGAGPYIAFGLTGKVKAGFGSNSSSVDAKFGGNNMFKSTDIGLNGIAGLQLKNGFLFHLNYDLGLSNILNATYDNANANDNNSVKTRTFGLSVGYAF
ncbi:porin family protein [Mucilaginibacter sp.]|uniref:porin family protein n=1 Tax=Mucilaginibacter sp. TaxID=1882438 RepID=UPI00284BC2BA|nr:porin family protein [Mucilaginibacter sp.]MDR3696207.1 porin family protein [Mucilaginibacter sp.]